MVRLKKNDFAGNYFLALSIGAVLLLILMVAFFVIGMLTGTEMGDSWILLVIVGALVASVLVIFLIRSKAYGRS